MIIIILIILILLVILSFEKKDNNSCEYCDSDKNILKSQMMEVLEGV